MKKFNLFILAIAIILVMAGAVNAGTLIPSSDKAKEKAKAPERSLIIPAHAIEVAPGLFYLGTAVDNGRLVEGYAMFAKPGTVCGNGICEPGENARKCPADCAGEDPAEPDTSSCYGFLAKGAKWKVVEPYVVDPTNTGGLISATSTFINDNLALDIDKWEAAAGVNILGEEISGIVDGADLESPDNKNEVYFADINSPGAIGVTIIWGIFGGPPPFRELVEWDMIFDDADFDWSAAGETGKMDFESIATHELGHSVGLGDLYTAECSEQTMYGYASNGETKKRTLETGDITGIQKLYGN